MFEFACICVVVNSSVDVKGWIWGLSFNLLLFWCKVCLVCAALLLSGQWVSKSPVSASHLSLYESWHYRFLSLGFSYLQRIRGLNSGGKDIAFIGRVIPQSSIMCIWIFCLLRLLFFPSCTVFEQEKEWILLENEERKTYWWRDEKVSTNGGESMRVGFRGPWDWCLSWILRMNGPHWSFTWS